MGKKNITRKILELVKENDVINRLLKIAEDDKEKETYHYKTQHSLELLEKILFFAVSPKEVMEIIKKINAMEEETEEAEKAEIEDGTDTDTE